MKFCSAAWLVLCVLVLASIHHVVDVDAFVPRNPVVRSSRPLYSQQQQKQETKPCFYREPVTKQWKSRINILDLTVGQYLNGTVVQDLLEGKTGPKYCGVGRIDHKGEWQIVNGMMRLNKHAKLSVTKKQATRLRRKNHVQVMVSRAYPQAARFEVVVVVDSQGEHTAAAVEVIEQPKLIPALTLTPGQELVGTVTRVTDYGVFVDVGANRRGLLHIKKVADLYGHYIDKEQGLVEAGLERGARIRVTVLENEKKRLFLDFTNDVKQTAETERIHKERKRREPEETFVRTPVQQQQEEESEQTDSYAISDDEAAAWAAHANELDQGERIENYDDDYDDYDEQRDIEDALGLGTY